jgi:hypothetical protein
MKVGVGVQTLSLQQTLFSITKLCKNAVALLDSPTKQESSTASSPKEKKKGIQSCLKLFTLYS